MVRAVSTSSTPTMRRIASASRSPSCGGQACDLQVHQQMSTAIGDMPADGEQLEARQLLDHAREDPDLGQAQQREAEDGFGSFGAEGRRFRGSTTVVVGRHGIRSPKGGIECGSTAPGVVSTPGR
jgi:hypothetical protein